MSLVLGYANKDNAIIMSDGRAGGMVRPSENYNKTRKINDNIIIGFVGYAESAEYFIDGMRQRYDIENMNFDEFIECVVSELENDHKLSEYMSTTQFLIIGRNENGILKSIIFNGIPKNEDLKIIENPRIFAIGGTIESEIISSIYQKEIKKYDTPIVDCMKRTIIEVSELDKSINSNIFVQAI